ncbi:MAG: phosphoribosylanthranilate isomerase [Solirubrobacteraceae bacterium]|nr:phosphoribosylanthranilate isomerase [Solirubrobacteraceae bacterium]
MESRAPRIKFCGVTNLDDAHRAADLGAWAIGLIFHGPSPRRCDPDAATAIVAALRRRLEIFGVWVNRPLDEVAELADATGVTGLQLHGDEGPVFCGELARRTGCKVMKAARVRSRADVQALRAFSTDYHLLDSSARGLPGGTGETFDWSLVSSRRRGPPLVLSGGLTPANVAEAIGAVRPWAVDVASGVEAEPGRKDPDKLAAFAAAVAATAQPEAA